MEEEPLGYLEVQDEEGTCYRWPLNSIGTIERILNELTDRLGQPDTIWL